METGGCWVDADTVCLKPYDFDVAFSSEGDKNYSKPNVGVLMYNNYTFWRDCYLTAYNRSQGIRFWGEIGPKLIKEKLEEYNLLDMVDSPNKFCPIYYRDFLLLSNWDLEFTEETYSVHLWNEMFRRAGIKEEETNCGWLKQMYLKYGV